jgi:hypothetical protein
LFFSAINTLQRGLALDFEGSKSWLEAGEGVKDEKIQDFRMSHHEMIACSNKQSGQIQ